ncbi:hypothetical protein T10_9449 [Trichinella papuae]|uniref:Uncharacterized protein n=1 Tax=Trichinella papuae TaxID=268474 RepID=A0A0V1MLC4_9BILA|nr:hypothetical protein T10_9449 [Trichinella papuae]
MKVNYTIGSMDPAIMEQCFHIIESPPLTEKYDDLKKRISELVAEVEQKLSQSRMPNNFDEPSPCSRIAGKGYSNRDFLIDTVADISVVLPARTESTMYEHMVFHSRRCIIMNEAYQPSSTSTGRREYRRNSFHSTPQTVLASISPRNSAYFFVSDLYELQAALNTLKFELFCRGNEEQFNQSKDALAGEILTKIFDKEHFLFTYCEQDEHGGLWTRVWCNKADTDFTPIYDARDDEVEDACHTAKLLFAIIACSAVQGITGSVELSQCSAFQHD